MFDVDVHNAIANIDETIKDINETLDPVIEVITLGLKRFS
jgi:hypothetical protein